MLVSGGFTFFTERLQRRLGLDFHFANVLEVETVQRFHTPLLIHGHTHRENIHCNADYTRIVLGDWRDNYASILEVDAEGYRFIAL